MPESPPPLATVVFKVFASVYSMYCYGMTRSQEQTQTFSVYLNDCFLNLNSLVCNCKDKQLEIPQR